MLFEKKIPGWEGIKGFIKVIEFQKRCLPHIHVLAILERRSSMAEGEIDKYAIVEILDKEVNTTDWKNVVTFMLHKPCVDLDPDAPCCQNRYGECESGFPENYCERSHFAEEDGSAVYRRCSPKDSGGSHVVKDFRIGKKRIDFEYTSRDVVLHNLFLPRTFKCHINVKIFSSLKVIKYLLWYPFKGKLALLGL